MNNLRNEISAISDRKIAPGGRTIDTGLLSGDASEKASRDSSLRLPAQAGSE